MRTAVLLMAYGSPTRMEDVMEYLEEIYEGKPVPDYAIEENTKKYRMFNGRSPSNHIVEALAEKISKRLGIDGAYRVFLGNKHWKPGLADAVSQMEKYSPDKVIAIPLFPFPSNNVESSYKVPLMKAMETSSLKADLTVLNGFHENPKFIEAWTQVLKGFVSGMPKDTFYLFSAHSLPTMRDPEEQYRGSFFSTAGEIAGRLGIRNFGAGFQSRGKYGSTWLEPSVDDVFRENAQEMGDILAAIPLGFIYDHLEILYDLDYEFGGRVKEAGKNYQRSALPNDTDIFVECLAASVEDQR